MKNLFKIFVVICLCFSAGYCVEPSTETQKSGMLHDLNHIGHVFDTYYGPTEWKAEKFGFDNAFEIQLAIAKAQSLYEITPVDFKQIVADFLHSTHDYHVNAVYKSGDFAYLPFKVSTVGGKCYITYIDPGFADVMKGVHVGDELVSFDSIPAYEVIRDLIAHETGTNRELTDIALADEILTTRIGASGHRIPRGNITIGVIPYGSESEISVTLTWINANQFNPPFATYQMSKMVMKSENDNDPSDSVADHPYFRQKAMFNEHSHLLPKMSSDGGRPGIGSRTSYVPTLGKILWKSSPRSPFDAYIFKCPGKQWKGGYVRIPSYMVDSPSAFIVELGKILTKFDQETDILVIDQVDNGGGLVFYAYAVLTMLIDQPIKMPTHSQTISEEEHLGNLMLLSQLGSVESDVDAQIMMGGNSLLGYPVNKELIDNLKDSLTQLIDCYNQGKKYTGFVPMYGIGTLKPHPKYHYTKPIVMLINACDFSAADIVPSILQDNERATLFGTGTAGAGGVVQAVEMNVEDGYSMYSRDGLKSFSYTKSLIRRVNGEYIENLGVEPDVTYEPSYKDYQENYKDYKKAIINALDIKLKL